MPSRTPFKKSISSIQPNPIPAVSVEFSNLPTTSNETTQAENRPDGPTLVPDGFASASRGAVFVDLNTNRSVPGGQSTGIQLEKDSNIFLDVKTSSRRSDLLLVSTPFLDIPDTELNELVSVRSLENGLDEADLELIGKSNPGAVSSLNNSRSNVKRIISGLTDLVLHTEKPLASLDVIGSSKEIISSIQQSVIELDLPCEQPNYSIEDLSGISDEAKVQSSTRILSMALAAVANDGDPGSEFVVTAAKSPTSKISGKSITFVSSMKSKSIGKSAKSKSAENPTNATSQNSIKKFSGSISKPGIGRTLVKSSTASDDRFKIPVTAIADRWDDLDSIVKYAQKTITGFTSYDNFDLARQGKPVKGTSGLIKSSLSSGAIAGATTVKSGGAMSAASATSSTTKSTAMAATGKSGRTASRSSSISGKSTTSKMAGGSKTSTSGSKVGSSSMGMSSSIAKSTSKGVGSITSSVTEKSSNRSATIVSRLCATISNILRREMMLIRATNAGLSASGSQDKVTAFTRSLLRTKSSVSSLSILSLGSSCDGKIVATHFDDKKAKMLLEPRSFGDQKKTYTGAYENLIVPAVKFPGNITELTSYVDKLKSEVITPVDQLLNIMLADIANVLTPTVVMRSVFAEVNAALSSLEEILDQQGGGIANEQIIELICMNLYASPEFKRRSKKVIYDKFLNPDKQFSFDGSSDSVSSSITNPDSKSRVKVKTTSNGETTETLSEIQVKDESGEDDGSAASPEDFAADVLEIRKILEDREFTNFSEGSEEYRAGTLTFQTRTSEMIDAFGKTGESTTLTQAVGNAVDKILEICKSAVGISIINDDETALRESGVSLETLTFMMFDLVSEICRSFFFVYPFRDTVTSGGTTDEDPAFAISLKSPQSEKGDLQSPIESYQNDSMTIVAESTGALLGVNEISKGSKILQSVAKEIQEYENDIRDHYARVFALNETFDTIYQAFDEFRTLLQGGDIGFARQQLSSRPTTLKTIELLSPMVLGDVKWKSDMRLKSIFDGTYTSVRNEVDCVQHFFRARNSIVTNDVIGDSTNSILCVVGVPFGMSAAAKDSSTNALQLHEVKVSKRDVEFQGLMFEPQRFVFDPSIRLVVRPQSITDTFQVLVEKRTQYFIFKNGEWVDSKYVDVMNKLQNEMKLKNTEAQQVIRNHVIDYLAKCFLRHVTHMEFSTENMFKAMKKVSTGAPTLINSINQRIPIAPTGTSLADFLKTTTDGYSVSPGPHSVDGSNEADSRLMYRLLQDPVMSGDFLIEEVFQTLPYENTYCVVSDPDTFAIQSGNGVPAAAYTSIVEALGEVTSIKDPGDAIIISTKTGKYMRQRNQIRGFSGSEVAVTTSVILPKETVPPKTTSKSNNKTGKFGYKSQGRRS